MGILRAGHKDKERDTSHHDPCRLAASYGLGIGRNMGCRRPEERKHALSNATPPTTYLMPPLLPHPHSDKTMSDAASETKCGGCNKARADGAKAFSKCGRCHTMLYCSRACQCSHWPTHKADCFSRDERKAQRQVVRESTVWARARCFPLRPILPQIVILEAFPCGWAKQLNF